MPVVKLESPDPMPSCRTDYATWTFRPAKEKDLQENIDWVANLANYVLPNGSWENPRKSRHFETLLQHDTGIVTEFSSTVPTHQSAGMQVITIPGAVWGALTALDRLELITDVSCLNGFYHCTRWDAQLTVLDHQPDIYEILRLVKDGYIWPKRYANKEEKGKKNYLDEYTQSPTQYFGSTQSNAYVRIYDHGIKHKWDSSSVRFEVQLRKQWADDHFRRLLKRANTEMRGDDGDLHMEEMTVKQTLQQHCDLRDTSKWVGKKRPKNWAQDAPAVDWYAKLMDVSHDTLKATHRQAVTWERATEVMIEQYGRKVAKQLLCEMVDRDLQFPDVSVGLTSRLMAKLQPEDLLELLAVFPSETADSIRERFHALEAFGYKYQEDLDAFERRKHPVD